MIVVYIAGPYRDERGEYFVRQNIQLAENAAIAVWKAGAVALCPHKNTSGLGGLLLDKVWLRGDLELLRRCDAIWLIGRWQNSEGARKERAFAVQNGIRIIQGVSDLLRLKEELA